MDWGGPGFVVSIIGLSMFAWIATTWIRAKHGYPLEGDWGGTVEKSADPAGRQLLEDNRALSDRVENAEDRIAVLERIITDEGYTTARQIEALRDTKEQI